MNAPADPRATMSYRAAKLAVIVLSALIILALLGLVVGGAMKLSGRRTSTVGGSGTGTGSLVLPSGARIVGMDTQSSRLVLHVVSPAGEEVDIVDLEDGRLVASIRPGLKPK